MASEEKFAKVPDSFITAGLSNSAFRVGVTLFRLATFRTGEIRYGGVKRIAELSGMKPRTNPARSPNCELRDGFRRAPTNGWSFEALHPADGLDC